MLVRYRRAILALIILLGFVLRFYAAASSPIVFDEMDDLPSVKKISFNLTDPKLPLIDDSHQANSPMPFKYIMRLGWDIFGESLMGARLPFVIIGTFIILVVYLITKAGLGTRAALMASFLLSISQFDIGVCRLANVNPPHVLFLMLSLFLFYEALVKSSKALILLNGLVIGLGFWIRESIIFLIPIYVIFLLVSPKFRAWLKNKYLWISFVIAFCVMLPLIYLTLNPEVPRFAYIHGETAIGISMNAIGFYLGELILLMLKPFPNLFNYVASSVDMEFPIVNFVLGLLILTAVVISISKKDPFIRLLVVCFLFNFIVFSFLRRRDIIDSVWSLGSLDWSIYGFVPGIILTANMLDSFIKRHNFYGKLLFWALVIFMFIRAWNLATYPLNCFFPTKDFFLQEQLGWARALKDGNFEPEMYLPEGNIELAKRTFKGIYKVADHLPSYKKIAALELAEILIQDGRIDESKKYLYYVLSQEADNERALKLLRQNSQR